MISSIKSVLNTDPMCVGDGTTCGKLVLALICQFIISLTIGDLPPEDITKMVDGKMTTMH